MEGTVEAHKKIILALNVCFCLVSPSIISTSEALLVFSSYIILCTIECGLKVIFPVASAAGRVDELLLKYAPYGHPLIHLFLY